jgi:hypothetical protein
MEIMQFVMLSVNTLKWDENSVRNDWTDAKRMVTNVQDGRPGEETVEMVIHLVETEPKSAPLIKWNGYIRVGTIKCSAF